VYVSTARAIAAGGGAHVWLGTQRNGPYRDQAGASALARHCCSYVFGHHLNYIITRADAYKWSSKTVQFDRAEKGGVARAHVSSAATSEDGLSGPRKGRRERRPNVRCAGPEWV
jgi:hypothetical protein